MDSSSQQDKTVSKTEPTVEEVMKQAKTQPQAKKATSRRSKKKVELNPDVHAITAEQSAIRLQTQQALLAASVQSGVEQAMALENIHQQALAETQLRIAKSKHQNAMAQLSQSDWSNLQIDFSEILGESPEIELLLGESSPQGGNDLLSLTGEYDINGSWH